MRLLPFLALLTIACGPKKSDPVTVPPVTETEPPPAETKPPPPDRPPGESPKQEQLTADTPRTTGAGVTFTAPAGWKIIASGQISVLEPPEPDSQVAIVDALGAKNSEEAVAIAWKLHRSDFKRKLRLATDQPPKDGFTNIRGFDYEVSPHAHRLDGAVAMQHGTMWLAIVYDVSQATLEKRVAQFGLFVQSVRPPGYAKESFKGKTPHKLDAARLGKIDAFVELAMKELAIPGVSIAIVQDGKVVHAKGFGVRELGKKQKVDGNTLFMIASNTKALSTLLLAQLVDDKKLRWDQKVVEAYPDFKLGNADTTAATQIKHLICACTGLPRQDLEWIFEYAKSTPLTTMALLASVQPTTKFGETYQYSNLLAAAAGYVAAHVVAPKLELGKAYDQAMQKRVFGPLGMKTTTFDFKKALRANHASAHAWDVDNKTRVAGMDMNYSIIPVRPAGGAWSSANELIRYVQMELAKGVAPGGKRIVSEANLLARREPQVRVGEHGAYGMGLSTDTKYEILIVDHGGAVFGHKSNMMWLPDHGIGAVILINADQGQALLGPFQRYLLEVLFDGKPEAEADIRATVKTVAADHAKERPRLTVPPDAEARKLLGTRYENPALGSLTVTTTKQGSVVFDVGEWKSAVASRKNEDGTTSFVPIDPGRVGLPIVAGKNADGARTLTARDAQHEYVFVEKR